MTKSLRRIGALARPWGRAALAAGALLALTLTQPAAVAIQPGNVDAVLSEARNYDRRLDLNAGFKAAAVDVTGARSPPSRPSPPSPTSPSRATTSSGPSRSVSSPART